MPSICRAEKLEVSIPMQLSDAACPSASSCGASLVCSQAVLLRQLDMVHVNNCGAPRGAGVQGKFHRKAISWTRERTKLWTKRILNYALREFTLSCHVNVCTESYAQSDAYMSMCTISTPPVSCAKVDYTQ